MADADQAHRAPFRDVAERLLEALVTATGADRIVLLLTERPDGQAGQLMLEAPAGIATSHVSPIRETQAEAASAGDA